MSSRQPGRRIARPPRTSCARSRRSARSRSSATRCTGKSKSGTSRDSFEFLSEAGDAVAAADPDAVERERLVRPREAVVRRGRAEVAGRAHLGDHTVVVAARGVAEEVDGHAELAVDDRARACDLAYELGG